MRPSILLAGAALVIGCAPRGATPSAVQPKSDDLTVRMVEPARNSVRYTLSEPAYVAVFAATRGSGIRLLLPEADSAPEERRPAGLNHQSMIGGARPVALAASRQSDRTMQTRVDAFYVVASRYPLPVEELLLAAKTDAPAPTSLREATDAIAGALTVGVSANAWDADVYVYPPNPSTASSRRAGRAYRPCAEERAFNRTTLVRIVPCTIR